VSIVAGAGREATDRRGEPLVNFPAHPHMLRHSCGHWLNKEGKPIQFIQRWLGQKNVRHTEIYAQGSSDDFKGFRFDLK
jgi:integrase